MAVQIQLSIAAGKNKTPKSEWKTPSDSEALDVFGGGLYLLQQWQQWPTLCVSLPLLWFIFDLSCGFFSRSADMAPPHAVHVK